MNSFVANKKNDDLETELLLVFTRSCYRKNENVCFAEEVS
jgi:hypothetical protein